MTMKITMTNNLSGKPVVRTDSGGGPRTWIV